MGKIIKCVSEILRVPVLTAADIEDGALMMRGVTGGTNTGLAIIASGACADSIGVMDGLFDYSVRGTSVTGASYVMANLSPVFNENILSLQYDTTDTMALASDQSTKTITITSLEDDIDNGFLYFVSGTAIGQLRFIATSASGSCTVLTATSPEADTADTCIKILPIFHPLAKLNTAGTKLGTDAAAGSWTVCVLENLISRNNSGKEIMDPVKHELDNLDHANVAFYSRLIVRNTAGHTID